MQSLSAILLVDDDPSTNYLNEAALYPLQLTTVYLTAHNGQQALDLLAAQAATPQQPVLVLLDMAMPVLNGMGFLEAFQALPASVRAAAINVVVAVSMSSVDLGQLEKYAVAGLVSKPLTPDKLTPILRLHFSAVGQG
jgi:CheY-like chemotaxis protein